MVERICKRCNRRFQTYASEIRKGGGKFCSRACYKEWSGVSHPTQSCMGCRKDFTAEHSEVARGAARFCSAACWYAWTRGSHHPRWIEKPTIECASCGKTVTLRTRGLIGIARFCSRRCKADHATQCTGARNPNWRGGISKEPGHYWRKYKDLPRQVLGHRISSSIKQALGRVGCKKPAPFEQLVGWSRDQLWDRLKHTMPPGYTWDDFVSGKLHIDHVIPITAFNFRSPDDLDFKRCWALDNLQLLPAEANMRKGAKLSAEFQPGLAFGLASTAKEN